MLRRLRTGSIGTTEQRGADHRLRLCPEMDLVDRAARFTARGGIMSNEVWAEVYERLGWAHPEEHRTTPVARNTRRLAERAAHQLAEPARKRRGDVAPRQPVAQAAG